MQKPFRTVYIALSAFFILIGTSIFPQTTTIADDRTVGFNNAANIDVYAQFVEAGYITVTHEAFRIPKHILRTANAQRVFTRKAAFQMHGTSRETISISCEVLSQNAFTAHQRKHLRKRWSCDDRNNTTSRPHSLASGHTVSNTISLSQDMIGQKGGDAAKYVSLQISYI